MVGHRILIPGIVVRVHAAQPFFRSVTQLDRVPVFETGGRGFESCRAGHKENYMKSVNFKNRLNGERVVCDNVRDVRVIDGVEYLVVHKEKNERQFLMRREALEKVRDEKKLAL